MTEHFDVATAAKLPEAKLRKLPKQQIADIAIYNGQRIRRILNKRQELYVEIARLNAELARRESMDAEAEYRQLHEKHVNMQMAQERRRRKDGHDD